MADSILENLRQHIGVLTQKSRAPQTPGYFEAQNYIRNELREMGYKAHDHTFNVFMVGPCTNIYAESTAPISQPRILIGAHYDTRKSSGPAADDNTSGVAVLLELARHLKRQSSHPFVFAFFDMEEIVLGGSLRGSRAFSEFYPPPIERAIILDTVGGDLMPGFENTYLQFGLGLQSPSMPGLEFLHLPIRVLEPMGKSFARSDYAAFRAKNIPFSFITSGTPWYYHTPADTPEIINWNKLEKLVHSLLKSVQSAKTIEEPPLESLHQFLKMIQNIPELQSQKIQTLIEKAELPSRWEMIKLYSHILPRIRKAGPSLWR